MSGSTKLTKTQIIAEIAGKSGLDKKAVNNVLDALAGLIKEQLGASGPGEFTIPNLVKLKAKKVAATQDRPGVNPFTKQPTVIKGKPASLKVKAQPVKALKDMLT